MRVWQVIGSSVREFFSPFVHIVARRRPPPPKKAPDEMTAHDFQVPLRDAVSRRLEVWGPVLVMLLTGLVCLAGLWWLSTR